MSGSPLFSTTLRHHVRIPYHFGGSLASCLDPFFFSAALQHHARIPFSFQRLSNIVFGSFFSFWRLFSIVFGFPFHFGGSPASCPDLISFRRLSYIVSKSLFHFGGSTTSCLNPLFVSTALQHSVQILLSFQRLSSIMSESSFSFRMFSSIVSGSPFLFDSSPTSRPNPLFILVALQHRVMIPSFFDGSLASCLDPLPFRWISDIVSGSFFFSAALQHHGRIPLFSTVLRHLVWILYLLSGFLESCPDLFSFRLLFDIVSGSSFFSVALRHRAWIPLFSTVLRHRV